MKEPVIIKSQQPLGELIGSVRIVEREPLDDWYKRNGITSLFDIFTLDGECWRAFFRSVDTAIGYCHQNLIPIEGIELLNKG